MPLSTHAPPLETERLALEPLRLGHAAEVFEALRDPELYRFMPGMPPAVLADLQARHEHQLRGPAAPDERWWNWILVLRAQPRRAIGSVELTILDGGERALLAYALGRADWGRGYATEACAAVLHYLQTSTPVRRVGAYIDTRNQHSVALVERLGFLPTETIENADHFKGSASDEYAYWLALGASEQMEEHAQT